MTRPVVLALCLLSGAACASARASSSAADCEKIVAQAIRDAQNDGDVSEAQPRKKNGRRVERMMEDSVEALGLDTIPAPVTLRFRVTKEGRAESVSVVRSSGSAAFDAVAVWAMAQGEFVPARLGGCPVAVWVEIPAYATVR